MSGKGLPVWWMLSLLSVASVTAGNAPRLVDAVREGDREAVHFLLKEPTDVNASQADGTTALAWAVHRDEVEMVELLIDAGAHVNAANLYGVTPLSLACTNRNALIVEKLLKAGANPNSAQATGETPLMRCVRTGSAEGVKSLLVHGADVNSKTTERGQTALMWAAAQSDPAIVQMLVEHGADLHARSARLALYTPRVPDPAQFNPTGVPVHQGYRETVYFPKFKGGFTPLMFAAQAGNAESARILLAAGADVNEGTPEEGSPLVLASSNGREKVALLLLEKGADPKATDCYGMTALHWALQEGVVAMSGGHTETDPFWVHPNMPELVKALLARGGDPNARIARDFMPYHVHRFARGAQQEPPQVSQAGATPFLLAAAGADIAAIRVLVEGGADPKVATFDGTTPLMVAAGMGVNLGMRGSDGVTEEIRKKALEAVRLAWELGGDVNAVDPDGRTAVHGAALYGLTEVIQFLADKGANLDAQDMWGQTAMSIALADPDGLVYRHLPDKGQDSTFRRRRRKDQKTVDLLLSLGAAPYISTGRSLKGF
ncbi:ankyrin repeat domain-containing protein [Acidobacteria bacterium AH-259-D05]|nr:ankyrin repeat domain-containing protein [Acidobacteria bacterium AH-259-D05]